VRRRRERVVRLRDQCETARARHLDHRDAVAHPPLRIDRCPERAAHARPPAVAGLAERVERPLAAVGERQADRRPPRPLDAEGERLRGLERREAATELVGAAEDGAVGHGARIERLGRAYEARMSSGR